MTFIVIPKPRFRSTEPAHAWPSCSRASVWKWVVIPLLLVLLMQFRPEGIMGRRELADVFPGLRKFYKFKG